MKSLYIHGIGDVRLHDIPLPQPELGEALLRVTAVGICGSDIHWFAEGTTGATGFSEPFILGHEFSAVVESGAMAGMRVAVEPHMACGRCQYCLEGNPNLCPHHYFAGQAPRDGALCQYLCWPERNLFLIPDNISDEAGALLEPLGVALYTLDLGQLRPGMRVGVYGCGPIGLMVVQLARLAGALQIVATDRLSHRVQAAKQMGATIAFNATEKIDLPEVDVAFEVAGDQDAVDTAIESCKPGGRVILCGIPSDNRTSFRASTARRKGLTIQVVRRMKHTYPRAIKLVEAGLIDVESLISHRFSLVDGVDAFKAAEAREGLKGNG